MNTSNSIPIVYIMLSSYCLACSLMEHFAIIPGWAITPSQNLSTSHKTQSDSIVAVYVFAKIALIAFNVLLLFVPHAPFKVPGGIPMWVVLWSTAMLSLSWIVSFSVMFPLQRRIKKGDATAIVKLVENDWFRVGAMVALCLGVVLGVPFHIWELQEVPWIFASAK